MPEPSILTTYAYMRDCQVLGSLPLELLFLLSELVREAGIALCGVLLHVIDVDAINLKISPFLLGNYLFAELPDRSL